MNMQIIQNKKLQQYEKQKYKENKIIKLAIKLNAK